MEEVRRYGLHDAVIERNMEMADAQILAGQIVDGLNPAGLTPLHYAIQMEDNLMIKYLVSLSPPPNVNTRKDGTPAPIHLMAETGNVDRMLILLRAGADLNLKTGDEDGLTPIHVAVMNKHEDVVRWLLGFGVSADSVSEGKTPLMCAVDKGDTGMIRLLLDAGANVNFVSSDEYGFTALHLAVKDLKYEIAAMLKARGADVSIWSKFDQCSPVHWAAQMGTMNMLSLLTENAIEASKPTGDGDYPVHFAALSGNLWMINFLVANRATPALLYNNAGYTPLHIAAKHDKRRMVPFIINSGYIEVDVLSAKGNWTPLHVALYHNKGDIADILIASGANVNSLTSDTHYSPMHFAILHNSYEYLETLYECKGDLSIHQRADHVEPLLVMATTKKCYGIAKYLLDCGAHVDAADDKGFTALHHAVSIRLHRFIRLLLTRRASVNIQAYNGETVLHFLSRVIDSTTLDRFSALAMDLGIVNNMGMTPVHTAAWRGNYKFLDKFATNPIHLFRRTEDENMDYPFHLAALGGHAKAVLFYLGRMNVDIYNAFGRTVLYNAAVGGSVVVVSTLLARGASVNGSEQSLDCKTPLHAAITNKHVGVVRCLLDANADVNARVLPEQYTPLHLAVFTNDVLSLRLLLDRGADRNLRTIDGHTAMNLARSLGRQNMLQDLGVQV
ncbi:uncharacterized protein LOC110835827 [Zootermopsis nevadensis]|uniref:Ankyrin-3 n=1 Tax=Zootermopsis nevadensis TaxID=136037 RepID=A0A067R1Y7_ZOONE|nr:uncharacterized protein LOC110835827 [Zootermopsis nevadensis]KDR12896.1 Ankyrin-3 [Zootermopsis nevadensis]